MCKFLFICYLFALRNTVYPFSYHNDNLLIRIFSNSWSRSFAGELGYLATAPRLKEENQEAMGERQPAICAGERAMGLNAIVGVKNMLKKLKTRQ